MRIGRKLLTISCWVFLAPVLSLAQNVPYSDITLSSRGTPVGGAPIAVCGNPGLATTAAQVISNIAVLTMSSNPITAGFVANQAIAVSGFTGADTYFNGGTVTSTGITNNFLILSVTSTQITYALTHANASATTNGSVFQAGSQAQACAPLSSIFVDPAGATPITQPGLTSTGLGNYQFYAAPNSYYVQFFGATIGELVKPIVLPPSTVNGTTSLTNLSAVSINNVQMCDQFAGATADVKITACIAALPAAGGVADARGIIGAQSFASTLAINKTVLLWLGNVRITGPSSGDVIQVSAQGVIIRGSGSVGSISAATGTVIIAQTAAQADGIHFLTTNSGNQQYRVEDLTINDSTAGGTARTAGVGLHVDATTVGLNSVGMAQNLWISFFFYDMQIIRPITSIFTHIQANSAKRDGIDFQGDGTSTWCLQCYSNTNGRHNFSIWGMNYSGIIGGASDHAQNDGYHIDDCQNDGITCVPGNAQSIAVSITQTGAEVDCQATVATCAGIKSVDGINLTFSGVKVLNSKGQGIYLNGSRGVNILSSNITGSTNNDIDLDCSATPQCGGGLTVTSTNYTTTGGGQINSNAAFIGFNGTSGLFQTTMPFDFLEATAPSALSAAERCYGDSTLHQLKCAYNGNGFLPAPQTFNTAGTHSDSGLYQTATAAGCTTAASIGGVCATPITVTWPGSFADTNYKMSCSPNGAATNLPSTPYIVTKSNGSVTVNYFAITAAAASWPNVECTAVHN